MSRQAVIPISGTLKTNRSFWLLFSGQTISVLGTNVTVLVMPWIVLSLTHSVLQSSMTYALEFVPYIFFSIPAGALVDALNRKHIMILSNVVCALALASIPWAGAAHCLSMVQIYVVVLLVNSLTVLYGAANTACVPNLVATNDIFKANSILQGGVSIGGTFGTPLGGLLMTQLPASSVILLDAISYAVAAGCLSCIASPFRNSASSRKTWGGMLDGIRFLWRHPLFRTNSLILTVTNFAANAVFTVLLFHMKEDLHLSGLSAGVILGAWGIGLFSGSSLSSWLDGRYSSGRTMRISRVCATAAPLLFAVSDRISWMCFASALTGLAMVLYTIQSTSFRQLHTPDELAGRVGIAHTMLARIAIPVGAACGGMMAEKVGAEWVFISGAAIQFIMGAVLWLSPLSSLGIRGSIPSQPAQTVRS